MKAIQMKETLFKNTLHKLVMLLTLLAPRSDANASHSRPERFFAELLLTKLA